MASGSLRPASRDYIGVGLLGLGVVGSGVARALSERADLLAEQAGTPLRLTGVLVRDSARSRAVDVPPAMLTTDPARVIDDPRTDVVVEVMGGEDPAHAYIVRALEAGKSVVTANKEVMAKYGPDLQKLARERGVALFYEASVGGGIPLIASMRRGLAAARIRAVRAIINGTTNYILTRMAHEGVSFADALAQAQALGYAESDPRNDIEGIDASYKLAILAGLAFHAAVPLASVHHEGIGHLTPNDFRYARELGYTIKLLAITKRGDDGRIEARVHPAFLHEETLLSKVDGVYNAIQIDGDLVGQMLLYGEGAGSAATTSSVLSDVLEVARDICLGRPLGQHRVPAAVSIVQPMDDLEVRYYIRMSVADRPGVMAQIARVLGDAQISIASIIQKETDEEAQIAELVIMTHLAREASIQRAAEELTALAVVKEVGSIIRVEE